MKSKTKSLTKPQRTALKSNASGRASQGRIQPRPRRYREHWAENIADLAAKLGVDRTTVTDWRRDPTAPKPTPNGRHFVPAWRDWARQQGKRPFPSSQKAAAQFRRTQLACEKLEMELARLRAEYTRNEEIKALIKCMVADADKVFSQLPGVIAPRVVSLSVADAAKFMRSIIDEALGILHASPENSNLP